MPGVTIEDPGMVAVMVPLLLVLSEPILTGAANDPVLLESCAVNTLPTVKVPVLVYEIGKGPTEVLAQAAAMVTVPIAMDWVFAGGEKINKTLIASKNELALRVCVCKIFICNILPKTILTELKNRI